MYRNILSHHVLCFIKLDRSCFLCFSLKFQTTAFKTLFRWFLYVRGFKILILLLKLNFLLCNF